MGMPERADTQPEVKVIGRSQAPYWTVRRVSALCRESATRAEALQRVRLAYPAENLDELVQHLADFRAIKT